MRGLKFRVWSKDQKTYDYKFPHNSIGDFYVNTRGKLFSDFGNTVASEVRQEAFVVEQYTGLKDQYSKEIYEGDIIKVAETVKGYVTQDVEGRWIIFGDDRKPIDGCITLGELGKVPELNLRTILATEYCSIIGNIHENPELLESKSD